LSGALGCRNSDESRAAVDEQIYARDIGARPRKRKNFPLIRRALRLSGAVLVASEYAIIEPVYSAPPRASNET
jgi:hypothetical protein